MAVIFPHEFIAREAIHAVKAAISRELVKLGMAQREIAELMQSQTSTISQYVGGQRGSNYELSDESMTIVSAVAEAINENPDEDLLKFGVSQVCNHIIEEKYDYDFDKS